MSQTLHTIVVTVTTAGTPVRVVSSASSPYRKVKSALFFPEAGNSGSIYIGDASVADDNYAAVLVAESNAASVSGDHIMDAVDDRANSLDLYNTWVDSEDNGDVCMVTVLVNNAD